MTYEPTEYDYKVVFPDIFKEELRSVYGTYWPRGKKTILTIVELKIKNRILHIEKEWKDGEEKERCIRGYEEAAKIARGLRDCRKCKWAWILEHYGV